MAGQDRATPHDIEQTLLKEPHKYGFFQLMRLLACVYKDKPRWGYSSRPIEDSVRLAQDPSLTFESATVSQYAPGKNGLPPRLIGRFFGMLGPNGPLPLHLTEYIHERMYYYRDHTLTRFVDMFHHRMMSLFYRAWADTEPVVSYDRPESDRFGAYVGALSGLGSEMLQERDAMPDIAKLYYTGFLSCRNKHKEGLRAMLADYFRLPVAIEEFIGEWLHIQTTDLTCLGVSPRTGELGVSTIVGTRVWACQHKFRIRFGPLQLNEYLSFLPNQQRTRQLVALVRNYLGDELVFDANLVLKKEEVPEIRLDGNSTLGWTTWLGERKAARDADDLRLNLCRK
ncbi:MAG: type VI secretion system baseplate subunit TssG [Methylococcaceae bacterium]|nr:type VI secretion system baseplate subunit TssG [Methylococcaceae bacterium]